MEKTKIYFRADGSSKIGLGHVIRSLALADMLKEQFDCHFIIRNPLRTLHQQILEVCQDIIILPEIEDNTTEARQLVENHFTGKEVIVLDGYHFSTEYQRIIRQKGCKVVCIDDVPKQYFVADAIINHAGGVLASDYEKETYTRLFLGEEYALLRPPFLRKIAKTVVVKKISKVFTCFGGADTYNMSLKTVKACVDLPEIKEINVVLAASYPHSKVFFQKKSDKVKLHSDLSATELADLMEHCDLAVVPSSTISLEALAMKMKIILGLTAENQRNIHDGLVKYEHVESIGSFANLTIENLREKIEDIIVKTKNIVIGQVLINPNSLRKIFNEL